MVVPSLLVGLVFGYAMKNSGLWLAARKQRQAEQQKVEAQTEAASQEVP